MASVNKVILLGNCGRDPEVRYLPDGRAVANVSIATSTRRKNRETGEVTEDTQWHRVTFYERLAEVVAEYVKKGNPIYVEGRLKYGKYTDQSGVEKYTTDIIATELQLLGGRDSGGQQGDGGYQGNAPQGRGGYQGQPQGQQGSHQQNGYAQQSRGGQGGYQQTQGRPPVRGGAGMGQPPQGRQPAQAGTGPTGFDDMDDMDIPF